MLSNPQNLCNLSTDGQKMKSHFSLKFIPASSSAYKFCVKILLKKHHTSKVLLIGVALHEFNIIAIINSKYKSLSLHSATLGETAFALILPRANVDIALGCYLVNIHAIFSCHWDVFAGLA